MLILGLLETGLELIPTEIVNNPTILSSAQLRGKTPETMLLDESFHANALHQLPDAEKRGRPDIAHRSLLTALDSVLAREQQLDVFLHTYEGKIITIKPGTRLPRRTPRFVGLIEQLLVHHRVPTQGEALLQIRPGTLETYLQELHPTTTILLSPEGTPQSPLQLAQTLQKEPKPVVFVGGFAHGQVSPAFAPLINQQVSFDPALLPTSTVVGMLIHGYEQALNLTAQRFRQRK